MTTGVEIKANPLKIVAGLEPEETNVLLQMLGKMVIKKADTSNAVSKITGAALPSQAQEEVSKAETSAPKTPVETENEKEQPQIQSRNPSAKKNEPLRDVERPVKPSSPTRRESPHRVGTPKESEKDQERPLLMEQEPSAEEPINEEQRTLPAPMARKRERPMSARAPPPKIKQEQISEPDAPSSVPIHIDGAKDDDDEFLVQTVDDVEINKPGTTEVELSGQHGGLVQKILQTKRQLEGTTEGTLESKKNSAKGPVGAKEIESLRASIQLLCQSTNPLGKTLDYLQEDADAMNKELELWKRETANFKFQAEEQAKFTMESMLPLQDQLKQLEKTIEEQVQKISSLKSDILQNDSTIEKLLKNVIAS